MSATDIVKSKKLPPLDHQVEERRLRGYCRVDFAGGTTDLWPLYCYLNGSRVINMAIPVACNVHVQFESQAKFSLAVESRELNCKSKHTSLKALELDLLKTTKQNPLRWVHRICFASFLRSEKTQGAWRVSVQSDAPPGSGLGGSSVLGVTLLKALSDVLGDPFEDPWELHHFAFNLESAEIEKPAGEQDYIPAIFGGLISLNLSAADKTVEKYPSEIAHQIGDRAALIHTGKPHHSGINNWDVFKKFHEGNKKVQSAMKSIQALSDRMDLCLKQNKIDEFVMLINNEWDFRKKLSNTFDVPVLRQAWAFGKKQGAISRKACGAGGGGALLLMFKNKTARDWAVAQKLPTKDWQWISLAAVDDGFFS